MQQKTVLRGKFIEIKAFLKKQDNSQINNVTHHLKELEKEQTKPKASRRKDLIKVREKIKNFFKSRGKKKINETKSCFFERVNKINKPLAMLTKKTEDINKIRNERGEITINTAEV